MFGWIITGDGGGRGIGEGGGGNGGGGDGGGGNGGKGDGGVGGVPKPQLFPSQQCMDPSDDLHCKPALHLTVALQQHPMPIAVEQLDPGALRHAGVGGGGFGGVGGGGCLGGGGGDKNPDWLTGEGGGGFAVLVRPQLFPSQQYIDPPMDLH